MLDKFRDLSVSAKITIMFTGLFVAIGLIFALGLGIKALSEATSSPTQPSDTVSPSVTPSPSETDSEADYSDVDPDLIDAENPDTVGSDKDDISLQEGFAKAEQLVMALCNVDSGTSYSSYVDRMKPFFASDVQPNIISESLYNEIKTQSCEINVGQPQGQEGDNRYLMVMAVSTTTEYKAKAGKIEGGGPYNVIMGIEKGKWVAYGVSIG